LSKPKAVKDWEDLNREMGCVITGRCDVQLHHIFGRTAKEKKILIGPWAILTLWWEMHDPNMSHPENVTTHRKAFTRRYGLQKDLFLARCQDIVDYGYALPFGEDVLNAIRSTTR